MESTSPSVHAARRRIGELRLDSRGLIGIVAILAATCWLPRSSIAEENGAAGSRRDAGDAAHEELLKINYVFNRELYEIAIPRYLKLLEKYPDFEERAMVHYAIALSYHSLAASAEPVDTKAASRREEQLRSAVEHARLSLDDKDFEKRREALDVLAQDLLLLGEAENAARVYEALVEASEGEQKTSARLGLAEALYRRGDHEAAERTYREILESLGPDDRSENRERAVYYLALSLYRQGGESLVEARDLFTSLAAARGSMRDDSLYMSALCAQTRGEHAAALREYERLLREGSPEWREAALFGVGTAQFHLEQHAECLDVLQSLVDDHPGSRYREQARLYIGRAMMATGKLRSGAGILNELRRSREVGAEASLWLARAYSSQEKHSQAIKIIDAAIRAYPRSPHREVLELELAIELVADRRFETALKILKGFAQRHPDSEHLDHAAYLEAFALHRAGDREGSLAVCRRARADHPASEYEDQLRQLEAENLFLTGEYAEAEEVYDGYLQDFSESLSTEDQLLASYRLAEARFLQGAHAETVRRLDQLSAGPLAAPLASSLSGNPVFADYHYLLGEASYQLEDYERAARELKAYLSAHPEGTHAVDARFKRAHALHLAGETEAAARAYREAAETDPESPHRLQIHFELAQLSLESKDLDAARASFRRVLEAGPRSPLAPHACHYLGWIAQQQSRSEEAVEWYRKLVDDYPQHERHAEGLYLLALNLQALQRKDEANEVIERLRREHPGNASLERLRLQEGIGLSRGGQPAEALKVFHDLESQPLPAELKALLAYEKAWCYRALDQREKASEAYREMLRIDAGGDASERARDLLVTARLELAELEFDRGQLEPAREILAPLVREAQEPVREKALYRLCWCHYREGDVTALQTSYRTYRERYADGERTLDIALLVARSHLQADEFQEAAKIFTSIIAKNPDSPQAELAMVSHAECLNEERRFDAAREKFLEFLREHPRSQHAERAHFGLGWAEENRQRLKQAVAHYRRASGSGSKVSARAQFQIGQCLAAQKEYEDAIVEFLQVPASHRDPEWCSRALLQVGGCFEALGQVDKARAYYGEVVEKFPDREEARLAAERKERLPR